MPAAPAKPKKALERVAAFPVVKASAEEATQGSVQVRLVADDTDASNALRCEALRISEELASPSAAKEAGRRETIVSQATAFARQNV